MTTKARSTAHRTAARRALRTALTTLVIALSTPGVLPTPEAQASPLAPRPERPGRPGGVEVTVTPEMTGAGMVSSGVTLPAIPPVTGNRKKPVPSWGKPLPYPIVIADRRNNRLLEVAPDKRIVWEFPSPNLKVYRGNEDVNFSADGKQLAVSEEDNFDVTSSTTKSAHSSGPTAHPTPAAAPRGC
jgi:hypothetical protein